MAPVIIVGQGTDYKGRRYWTIKVASWRFDVLLNGKELISTAPWNTDTERLGKKWDIPASNQVYHAAYVEVGRLLAKEKMSNQLKLPL